MRELVSETRALCAQPPSAQRDVALSALFCFHPRQELERSGAWGYLARHLEREGGKAGSSTPWSDSSWYNVRRGRPFGQASGGRVDLSGERWIREDVLDEVIARSFREPIYSLDLSGLGKHLTGIALELFARADLRALIWLDLSWGELDEALWQVMTGTDGLLPSLRSLELRGNASYLELDRAGSLARSLVHLGLANGEVDASWLRAQIRPEVLPALRSLDLSMSSIRQGVWEVFGARRGFESMYALRLQGSELGMGELEHVRWLPCMSTLDTFSVTLPEQSHATRRASESMLALFTEDVLQVYDLGISVVGLSCEGQIEALEAVSASHCYRNLCALELDGVSWEFEALDALQMSMVEDGSARLCALSIRRPHLPEMDAWDRFKTHEILEQRICAWGRLAQVEELKLFMDPLPSEPRDPGPAYYVARYEEADRGCAWLSIFLGIAREVRVIVLGDLSAIALASFWRNWSRGERLDRIERLELHEVEFNTIYFQHDMDGVYYTAPHRIVFSGAPQELETSYLRSLQAARPHTPLARWFERMSPGSLEPARLAGEEEWGDGGWG